MRVLPSSNTEAVAIPTVAVSQRREEAENIQHRIVPSKVACAPVLCHPPNHERAGSTYKFTVDEFIRLAEVGIGEFWTLNLEDDQLEIHRQPEGAGYRELLTIPADGTASPLAFPDVTISLSEIIQPR